MDVATLYVRNIPADLYEQLQRWAAEDGRSVNAEVVDLLQREAQRRAGASQFSLSLAEYRRKWEGKRVQGPPWATDLLIEDRRRGHKPDFGY